MGQSLLALMELVGVPYISRYCHLLSGHIVNGLGLDPCAFPWVPGGRINTGVQFLTGGSTKGCMRCNVVRLGLEYFEQHDTLKTSRLNEDFLIGR